jgi:hypothetical protein
VKSRKTILLLVLVISIWGVISFQIYAHFSEDEPEMFVRPPKRNVVLVDSTDRFPLMLNYTDPFLKKVQQEKKNVLSRKPAVQKAVVVQVPVQAGPIIAWDRIEYFGSVFNANRQSTVAIIRIYGVDYLSRQGDVINNFTVSDIRKDSVLLTITSQSRYIKKNK